MPSPPNDLEIHKISVPAQPTIMCKLGAKHEGFTLRAPSKINASIFQAETAYRGLFLTKIEAFILLGTLNLEFDNLRIRKIN